MNAAINQISAVISQQTGNAQRQNTLAFCVDDNYLPFALFVANQFIEHHPNLPCDICICMPDISQVPESLLSGKVRFIEMKITGINEMPVGSLSLAAYYRLFLPTIFADTYDYIIYLDADTYINRPFYDDMMAYIAQFPDSFSVAAAADITELNLRSPYRVKAKKVDGYVSSYHKFNHVYRNSGVLLFHTKNYDSNNELYKIFSYANSNIEALQCHDQSALNGALLTSIALLPFTFNWQVHKLTYSATKTVNPYIIHFISENKPWRLDNKFTKEYQKTYKDFLQAQFPQYAHQVLTAYEQRKKTPKYSSVSREFVSRESQRLKQQLTSLEAIILKNKKDKYHSEHLLNQAPFTVTFPKKSNS